MKVPSSLSHLENGSTRFLSHPENGSTRFPLPPWKWKHPVPSPTLKLEAPCSLSHPENGSNRFPLPPWKWAPGSLSHPEIGSSRFLQNPGNCLPNYTASRIRRQYPSKYCIILVRKTFMRFFITTLSAAGRDTSDFTLKALPGQAQ